jgi:dinuclear metal center YbgI/SA1388 family protein
MKIKDITNCLEEFSPLHYAEDFDNVGLLVGEHTTEVTGVLITLDTLEDVVEEAIDKNCNLIVSFHPIIFKGLKKLNGATYVERAVIKAIKNNIAIYAIHTALDNSNEGVNAKICNVLGLSNQRILIPKRQTLKKITGTIPVTKFKEASIGMGMIGELKTPCNEDDFIEYVKVKMNTKFIRHSKLLKKPVKKIAVLGGSGSFAIEDAIRNKADVFITSDLKYHDFFRAESSIVLFDIGHFESEQFTVDLLFDIIKEKFPSFTPCLSKKHLNPINYS